MLADLVLSQKKLLLKSDIAPESLKAKNYYIMEID